MTQPGQCADPQASPLRDEIDNAREDVCAYSGGKASWLMQFTASPRDDTPSLRWLGSFSGLTFMAAVVVPAIREPIGPWRQNLAPAAGGPFVDAKAIDHVLFINGVAAQRGRDLSDLGLWESFAM